MDPSTTPGPRWIQSSALPPDRMEVTIVCHLSGPANALGVTVNLRDGLSDNLRGLVATAFDLTDVGMAAAGAFISGLLRDSRSALSPF